MDAATDYIQRRDKVAMAKFILDVIPGGDSTVAVDFLEGVIDCMRDSLPNKRSKVSDAAESADGDAEKNIVKDASKDVFTSFYVGDTLDHNIITLALQFPDDQYFTAYVIGLRGQNVLNIGKKTGTRIKVENEGTRGEDHCRHIFIMGPLKGTIRAYHVSAIHLKQPSDQSYHNYSS